MLKLELKRPLAVFDIEATGTSPRGDRIIELAIVKLMPDGMRFARTFRVNPGIPVPPAATAIHGIFDADVADCPQFAEVAGDILELFADCDIAGYNVTRFDIPMLTEEFLRADMRFSTEGRRIIDVQRIFHRREPRDLSAALSYYCDEIHSDAHGAESDVMATIRVLEAQFERYPDLPRDMDELNEYCNPRDPDWVDGTGKLKWVNNVIVLNFGRKKGVTLRDLVKRDPGFIKWMLKSDFPRDTREIVANAMEGKWPRQP